MSRKKTEQNLYSLIATKVEFKAFSIVYHFEPCDSSGHIIYNFNDKDLVPISNYIFKGQSNLEFKPNEYPVDFYRELFNGADLTETIDYQNQIFIQGEVIAKIKIIDNE